MINTQRSVSLYAPSLNDISLSDSIVLNSNPFLGFIDDPVPANNTQLNRATNLILSSLRFFR